ncbi:MAG: peptidoglycan DD-metalloendopeptidase family protein [Bacilli bacterium]|nr:peptidoglycan DD-metalloendopeptidase family protein [Bacilli bacterium]
MKKILNITLSIFIALSIFMPTTKAQAKTINDFQKELDQKEAQYNANKNKQNEITNNKKLSEKEIKSAQDAITKAEKDMIATGEKIQKLDREIENKNSELEELMKFFQKSSGDMVYLEYVFGSADMTDFIHRISMIEELTAYNEQAIDEMNQMIEESKELQIELKNKQVTLNQKIDDLNKKVASYSVQIDDLSDIQVDVLEEIKTLRETIKYYKDKGCKANQDINSCLSSSLPYDTAFWRPVNYGYVSSEYGGRVHPVTGVYKIHYGTDIAVGRRVTNIYASAAGKVAVINNYNSNSCGGNYVIIHHNIKGVEYSTGYFHMEKVYVKVGQQVTKDTILGLAGGNPYGSPGYTPWDKCSTGQHVHFTMAKGLKLTVNSLYNASFNGRTLVNFPKVGSYKYFSDRTTKY